MNALTAPSHRTQLVITALSACLFTSALFTAYNAYTKRERRRNLNDEVLRSLAGVEAVPMNRPPLIADIDGYNEDLIREQLARNYAFFGEEGMAGVRTGSVAVIGCGGVGSWAAVMLVRS